MCKIDRLRLRFLKDLGVNMADLTHERNLVYISSGEPYSVWIFHFYKNTLCGDDDFYLTALNSEQNDAIFCFYKDGMRSIDEWLELIIQKMRKDVLRKLFQNSKTEFDSTMLDSRRYLVKNNLVIRHYKGLQGRIAKAFSDIKKDQFKNEFYVFSSLNISENSSDEERKEIESLRAKIESDNGVVIDFFAPYQEYLQYRIQY